MKFINTKMASPVIYEGDKPHELDLYNHDFTLIPDTENQLNEFLGDNKIIIDDDWWELQEHRCTYGYTVKNAVTDGGDLFPDDNKITILDPKHPLLKLHKDPLTGGDIILKKGDRYIPHLRHIQRGNDLWIPPKMYYYLNFWVINRTDKEAKRKKVGNPYFTDLSWENWMIRRRTFIEELDHIWAKTRQRGLSEEGAANMSWMFQFLDDVQLAIVSGEDIYTQNTFTMVKRGMERMKNTQFYKQFGKNDAKLLKSKNTGAEIHARTCLNNTQVLSGLSPFFAMLEEIGIWKKGFVKEVKNFLAPSQQATGVRSGWTEYVGTGGDIKDGVEDMEWILYNPKEAGVLEFPNYHENSDGNIGGFIPSWKFEIIDQYGNSLKEESLKKIHAERAVKDAKKRYLAIVLKPIVPSEIFNVSGSVFYGEIVKMNCLRQITAIHNNRGMQIVNRYQIEWVDRKKPWKGVKPPKLDADGPFQIAELPILGSNGKAKEGLYGAGCLLPGEQVITDKGLMNVEDVTSFDSLVNKNGDYVDISIFYKRKKIDSDVYTIKSSNTFRTNTVTEEHPVLISDAKFNPDKTINENEFDFSYRKANSIEIGSWTKVPNLYIRKSSFDISLLWNDFGHRIDRRIKNPLLKSDFWWFIGIWLGDGYCDRNGKKISISFNSKEVYYISRFEQLVNTLFKRKLTKRDRGTGATECSFNLSQLNSFLTKHFGKYSYGKKIPEWAKFISDDLKRQLLLGYLDSDGCISIHPKGYYITSYVSVNLELLESFQDIGFSLGIISSLGRLRKESVHSFSHGTYHTKECYQLRFNHHDTLNLVKQFNCYDDPKIKRIDFDNLPKLRKRPKGDCFISSDSKYIYFKIKNIEKKKYTGVVYNFECETHTYNGHHIGYHNCDSYDQDEAHTSTSEGACIIKKGVDLSAGLDSLGIYNAPIAMLLERPTTDQGGRNVFYENTAKLSMLYNAPNLIEYSKILIFKFYEEFGVEMLLVPNPSLSMATMVNKSKTSNKYGLHGSLIDNALSMTADYWKDEENIKNNYFIDILKATSRFKRTQNFNCDISIAFTLADLNLHEAKLIQEFNAEIEKMPNETFGYKETASGISNTYNS